MTGAVLQRTPDLPIGTERLAREVAAVQKITEIKATAKLETMLGTLKKERSGLKSILPRKEIRSPGSGRGFFFSLISLLSMLHFNVYPLNDSGNLFPELSTDLSPLSR